MWLLRFYARLPLKIFSLLIGTDFGKEMFRPPNPGKQNVRLKNNYMYLTLNLSQYKSIGNWLYFLVDNFVFGYLTEIQKYF